MTKQLVSLDNLYVTLNSNTAFEAVVSSVFAADEIVGNERDNLLDGRSGNDFLKGFAGDDHLVGGAGDDVMLGGTGSDLLSGDEGDDVLVGEDGDDEIHGGAGQDMISGGVGYDTVFGESDDDMVDGGEDDVFAFRRPYLVAAAWIASKARRATISCTAMTEMMCSSAETGTIRLMAVPAMTVSKAT